MEFSQWEDEAEDESYFVKSLFKFIHLPSQTSYLAGDDEVGGRPAYKKNKSKINVASTQ